MTIDRRRFLAGGAALIGGAVLGLPGRAKAQAAPPRKLITIFAQGGWDPVFALDPKVANPSVAVPMGSVRRAGGIDFFDATNTDGAVRTYFDRHSDVSAVIRGIAVRSVSHPGCVKRILTGTSSEANPDFAAIVAHAHAAELPMPYMVLGSTAFAGPYAASTGRLGNANQLVTLLDPAKAYSRPEASFVPTEADDAAVVAWLDARAERLAAQRGRFGANRRKIEAFRSSLVNSRDLRAYSDGMGNVSASVRFDAQLELAITMLQEEVCWSTAVATNLPWDSHTRNEPVQGPNHRTLFQGLTSLVDTLKSARTPSGGRMIDETAVAVVSEMGRTPTLNAEGGKDHWQTTAALLIGGGVTGDRTYGASSTGEDGPALESLPVDFSTGARSMMGRTLESDSLVAGILEWVGVDSGAYLPGVTPFMPYLS